MSNYDYAAREPSQRDLGACRPEASPSTQLCEKKYSLPYRWKIRCGLSEDLPMTVIIDTSALALPSLLLSCNAPRSEAGLIRTTVVLAGGQ
jgi:hypothetical protein